MPKTTKATMQKTILQNPKTASAFLQKGQKTGFKGLVITSKKTRKNPFAFH